MTKAARPKGKAPQDIVERFDCPQRSDEWFDARRGILTASRFATMMASGKDGGDSIGRERLKYILAGEILSGQTAETFRSDEMARGVEMEPDARAHYERTTFSDLHQVGFVKRTVRTPLGYDFTVGCSPDSEIGEDGALEIKTTRPDKLIEIWKRGAAGFPSEHRAQCHGTLWVTGRKWIDLLIFYRGMPIAPSFRIERDETYIAGIAQAAEKFCWEVDVLVKEIRTAGRRA